MARPQTVETIAVKQNNYGSAVEKGSCIWLIQQVMSTGCTAPYRGSSKVLLAVVRVTISSTVDTT